MKEFRDPAAVRRRVHVRDPLPFDPTREGQDLRERRTADDRSVVRQPFLRDVHFLQRIPAPKPRGEESEDCLSVLPPSNLSLARVELRGLSKAYDDAPAVQGLNLEMKDKEFVVLLGPSGCGKTTTLRCVAGLESPDDGPIDAHNPQYRRVRVRARHDVRDPEGLRDSDLGRVLCSAIPATGSFPEYEGCDPEGRLPVLRRP